MDGSQNSAEPGPSQRPRRLRVNQQQILNIFDQIDSDISDTDLLDSDVEQEDYDPRPNAGTAAVSSRESASTEVRPPPRKGRTKVWKKKKFDKAYKSTAQSLPVPGHDEPINYFTLITWIVFWKVRPIIDIVQKKTQTISPSEHLSCDEQMVPFTGNLDIKQYIRGKPCPWGIKIFVLCNADGRVLSFEIYQGKKTNMAEEYKSFGLGAGMVLNLAGRLQLVEFTKLYFDNFFTSLALLERLSEMGLYGTGTIRSNRLQGARLETDSDMKKRGRGSFCEVVASSGDTCLVKWMDNRSVILASNMIGSGAVNKVRRWCKQTKAYLQVDQPQVVSLYNQYMGGVDKMDQMLSYYRTFIRSKKWTMRLIFHMVDLSICNSWLEYVADRKAKAERSMDLLSFRMEIAEALTSAEGMTLRRRGRPRSLTSSEEDEHENVDESASRKRKMKFQRPCSAVKNDAFSHWPQKVKGQSRCKKSPCVLKTRTMCLKCNVPLCLEEDRNCFKEFHIKK
ncbi:hypothetical protein QYM36_004694 [Artemia franciscana]|uniref:PiggyBac transposable element-derived protein domain-containing protein n=1 Tax=Artemia franciscana TaxID=6661 RepID=A0AA88I6Q7_ARTSF|nr:hypothetical protein QYM36_004694 [Artemia franciscana]